MIETALLVIVFSLVIGGCAQSIYDMYKKQRR